ncbi:hypothetical protein ACTHO0_13285 [Cytobacillus praedii]|uniref:hypothetical protein n=1 Tax=Cytobacillus praedii TaxID=1742358 RepID=UPI003F804B24
MNTTLAANLHQSTIALQMTFIVRWFAKCSHEYDEWNTTVEQLEVEKIELKGNEIQKK